jgi:hypothetical protein
VHQAGRGCAILAIEIDQNAHDEGLETRVGLAKCQVNTGPTRSSAVAAGTVAVARPTTIALPDRIKLSRNTPLPRLVESPRPYRQKSVRPSAHGQARRVGSASVVRAPNRPGHSRLSPAGLHPDKRHPAQTGSRGSGSERDTRGPRSTRPLATLICSSTSSPATPTTCTGWRDTFSASKGSNALPPPSSCANWSTTGSRRW